MRVLGRVRLSRASDESTSIERQREIIEDWANANEHEVVGWADDPNTSGSVDPFDTVGLGPWLIGPKLYDWDILCAWKLDRLARRAVPLHRLFGLCQDHDKTLVCVADNIDLSTWVGRMIAALLTFKPVFSQHARPPPMCGITGRNTSSAATAWKSMKSTGCR